MKYSYYLMNYNGIDTLYRIEKGRIGDNVNSLEVFDNGVWSENEKKIKSFMNNYVTGWINEEDSVSYENAIIKLNEKIFDAKKIAIEKHTNQKYGVFPYEIHLINVVSVLLRHNIFYDKLENIDLWIAAWLHDVLEDTDYSEEEIIDKFGENVYEIVWSLTDGIDGTRKEKKQVMYEKLIKNNNAIIIKLADRIANLEFSIINNNDDKIMLYVSENIELNNQLKEVIQNNEIGKNLLNYLNKLVNSLQYLQIKNTI